MPLGNIKLSQHSEQRLELTDSLLVKTVGILGFSLLLLAAIFITSVSWLLAALCFAAALLVGSAALAGRSLLFARDAGVLVLRHRTFGIPSQSVVPLFHLRAVVVAALPNG
jgi:hypothetical protein